MKLVTFDRGGARRLGAVVDGAVIDLPEAVGHPAFPATMEALVMRPGGTMLDAARQALGWPDAVAACVVPDARLLVPIVASPLRRLLANGHQHDGDARLLGPTDDVPWPAGEIEARYEVELGCVVRGHGRNWTRRRASDAIFGYTLIVSWYAARPKRSAHGSAGSPGVPWASMGPCILTSDAFDPASVSITASIDGEVTSTVLLEDCRRGLADVVARRSRADDLYPGDVVGSGPVVTGGGREARPSLRPGAVIAVEAAGIGVLATRLAPRAA